MLLRDVGEKENGEVHVSRGQRGGVFGGREGTAKVGR